jgi:hypothetical protein
VNGNVAEVIEGDMTEGDSFIGVRFSDGTTEFVDADELASISTGPVT